jgi:hypothetical protein
LQGRDQLSTQKELDVHVERLVKQVMEGGYSIDSEEGMEKYGRESRCRERDRRRG